MPTIGREGQYSLEGSAELLPGASAKVTGRLNAVPSASAISSRAIAARPVSVGGPLVCTVGGSDFVDVADIALPGD